MKAQDRGLKISGYKIGGIKVIAYSTSALFESNRSRHKKLDCRIMVELHGLILLKMAEIGKIIPFDFV